MKQYEVTSTDNLRISIEFDPTGLLLHESIDQLVEINKEILDFIYENCKWMCINNDEIRSLFIRTLNKLFDKERTKNEQT